MRPHTPSANTTLILIFCILLLDVIGITVLYPIAPYIVRRYSDDALMLTLLNAIYAAAQFFGAPLLGKLGDRYGRRPVLLLSLLGSALGYILFGIGGALWVLFLARLIDGITAGNQSVAAAYIADISTPNTRTKNFTLIGMAWGLGLILGPALGATLGQIHLAAPPLMAAVLALISMLLGVVFLPESLPKAQRDTTAMRIADLNPFVSIGEMTRKPGLGRLLLVWVLFNFAFNAINSTETLFLIDRFAAQPRQIGVLLVLSGLTIAVVQRMVQRLVHWFGEQHLAIAALIMQALTALVVVVLPVLWPMYLLTMFRTVASGLTFPMLTGLMTNEVTSHEQGVLLGVTTALSSIMGALGPLAAGMVYDHVAPVAPYWTGAGGFMLAAYMLLLASSWRSSRQHT